MASQAQLSSTSEHQTKGINPDCEWMASHSWERLSHHAWQRKAAPRSEGDDDPIFWGESSDSDDAYADEGRGRPAQQLVGHLLDLHLFNKISAQDCCTAMHFAAAAGIDEAKKFALEPGASSGHCSRKIRTALGHTASNTDLYEFDVPGHAKHTLGRASHNFVAIPAHEQIAADSEEDAGCRTQLVELLRGGDLPPCYYEHPVVVANPEENVLPIALYIDAVPYSLNDSVLGWWIENLVTSKRYLFAVLRKQCACQCGCRGWDSFHSYFQLTRWTLKSLAAGVWPDHRHDNGPWRASDASRSAKAGDKIRLKCACIYIKGDWAEYASTMGLPPWNDSLRPCFLCNAIGGKEMYIAPGNSMEKLRWRENQEDDYRASCERCLHKVVVETNEDRDLLEKRLHYDKRQQGCRGRTLTTGIEKLGLAADDRLEPTAILPDVGRLSHAEPPIELEFWRCSSESLARRPNPLFDDDLGLNPTRALTVDTLHAFYLGVMRVWAKIVVWRLLVCGIYGDGGASEENLANGVLAFRAMLTAFYKRRHAQNPAENLTRITNFNMKLLGSRAAQCLKTKGAETYGLLKFLIEALGSYRERVGGDWQRLLQAGQALDFIVDVWQKHNWRIPHNECEAFGWSQVLGNAMCCNSSNNTSAIRPWWDVTTNHHTP